MNVDQHVDITKVATQDLEKALRIARYQGQWTSANSLRRQAELLGASEPMVKQFDVHIARIEENLQSLDAVTTAASERPNTTTETDKNASDAPAAQLEGSDGK